MTPDSSDPSPGRPADPDQLNALTPLLAVALQTAQWSGASISRYSGNAWAGVLLATDQLAQRIDELAVDLGEGPLLVARSRRSPVLLDLDQSATGSAVFERELERLYPQVRAVLVQPLQIGVALVGFLSLYSERQISLTDGVLGRLLRTADAITLALIAPTPAEALPARSGSRAERPSDSDWPEELLTVDHAAIHQAAGMLMVQLDSTIEVAMLTLRAHAYSHDRRVVEVARDVVARRLTFVPGGEATDDSRRSPPSAPGREARSNGSPTHPESNSNQSPNPEGRTEP